MYLIGFTHCRFSRLFILALIALTLLYPKSAYAEPTQLSKSLLALTGDWVAEDWKEGWIKMHPDKYTWQSDNYFEVVVEEPKQARNAKQVMIERFDTMTPNKKTFDSRDAEEHATGVWTVMGNWTDTYGDANHSIWGTIETKANTLISFQSNCQPDKGGDAEYRACLASVVKIIGLLQNRSLILPEPPSPLTIPNWRSSYSNSGVSTLTNSNYNRTVSAIIRVSPPLNIQADKLKPVIQEFGESSWGGFPTGTAKTPHTESWVGNESDPWFRSSFTNSIEDNTATVITGSVKTADGRNILISVNCPYTGWQSSCARGVEQAKFWIQTGIVEQRRQKIIAAKNIPLPANGMKNSDVLGIYVESSLNAGTFSMDGNYYFKNGAVYRGTEFAPVQIDPVASKQKNPESWGRWTRKGKDMHIIWGDGDTSEVSATQSNLLIGGVKGMRLQGYYGSISSTGNLITGSGSVNRSGYTFNLDGTFNSSQSNMFSVGGFVGDSVLPTQIASGGGGSTSAKSRYEIDGYTITFTYPDGQIVRKSFALYANDVDDPERATLYIGGSPQTLNGGE